MLCFDCLMDYKLCAGLIRTRHQPYIDFILLFSATIAESIMQGKKLTDNLGSKAKSQKWIPSLLQFTFLQDDPIVPLVTQHIVEVSNVAIDSIKGPHPTFSRSPVKS